MKKILTSPFLRYSILVILAIIIGINVFSYNSSRMVGDAMPMPLGFGLSTVLTGSMEPAISEGDLLIVRAKNEYQIGDIVVYQQGKTSIVHRITNISEETVTTQGDANNTSDTPFHISQIKGKVIAVIPAIGALLWALKTPIALITMLAAAILLVELSLRQKKADKEYQKEKIKLEIQNLIDELKEDK